MKILIGILFTLSALAQTTVIDGDWNIPIGAHYIPNNETFIVNGNINGNIILGLNANVVILNDAHAHNGQVTAAMQFTLFRQYNYAYWGSPVDGFNAYNIPPHFGETYLLQNGGWYNINTPTMPDSNLTPVPMVAGVGYANRGQTCLIMPHCGNGPTYPATTYNFNFIGPARNGHIQTPVNDTIALISNPYPSSINVHAFFERNSAVNTIYLWPRIGQPENIVDTPEYDYSAVDYIVVNRTGSNIPGPHSELAIGQGFMITMDSIPADGQIHFHNHMRGSGGTLARSQENDQRVYLKLSSTIALPSYASIGYVDGSTADFDSKYDGLQNGNSIATIYSILPGKKLAVQGRGAFDSTDVVQLGFRTSIAGSHTIEAQGMAAYIKDNGAVHPLPYTFSTSAGTFDSRFELVYSDMLNVSQIDRERVRVYPNPADTHVNIVGKFGKYTLYSVLGQLLHSGINSRVDLVPYKSGVYILKVDEIAIKIIKR